MINTRDMIMAVRRASEFARSPVKSLLYTNNMYTIMRSPPRRIRSQSAIIINIDVRADTDYNVIICAYDLLRTDQLTAGDRQTRYRNPICTRTRHASYTAILCLHAYYRCYEE